MSTTPPPAAVLTPADRKALVSAHPRIASAARWFWWIAGLSVVNTVLTHSGSDVSFLLGLGFTLLADNIFREVPAVAYAIDLLSIGFFVGMGFIALRGYRWAFIVGLVFYILDALIYLYVEAWLPLAFHVYASVMIIAGIVALNAAIKSVLAAPPAAEPAAPPPLDEPKQRKTNQGGPQKARPECLRKLREGIALIPALTASAHPSFGRRDARPCSGP